MTYDVNYFIKKFKAIPDKDWTTGSFMNGFTSQRCALGHCMSRKMIDKISSAGLKDNGDCTYKATTEDMEGGLKITYAFCSILNPENPYLGSQQVIDINNGNHPRYQQTTPKKRILAALADIKGIQKPVPSERIRVVYVSIPTSITEQTKELITN